MAYTINSQQQIIINGGKELSGSINISPAKNAVLPIMACCLLTEEPLNIENVPNLSDTEVTKQLLESLGVKVRYNKKDNAKSAAEFDESKAVKSHEYSLTLQANGTIASTPSKEISTKLRASLWLMSPLLATKGKAQIQLPGGCKIGERKINLHLELLRKMGAAITEDNNMLFATTNEKRLTGCSYRFPSISVGATITGILAATLAKGETILENCAIEPEIIDLCDCLAKMGARLNWQGERKLQIIGVEQLSGANHRVMFDRIEAGSYMLAAAITNSNLEINNIAPKHLKNILKVFDDIGIDYEVLGQKIYIKKHNYALKPQQLFTAPYPGLPTDMQAQFTSLFSIIPGMSKITENIFDNRFQHITELNKMGANISVKDKTALIIGTPALFGAEVLASDLRASKALVIAALIAKGDTVISGIEHLERGYVDIVSKLRACGANIERVRMPETAGREAETS
jgi:UDP-N-acetylglucosamine 1-carboxyvinyltransferase